MRNNLAQNKNIINTFETVKMKNYYIISLENFLSRSRNFTGKILPCKNQITRFVSSLFFHLKKKKKRCKCLLFAQYFSRIRNVMQIFRKLFSYGYE